MKSEQYYRELDQAFERSAGPLEERVLRNGIWFTRCRRCRNLDSELLNGICGTCGDDLRYQADADRYDVR